MTLEITKGRSKATAFGTRGKAYEGRKFEVNNTECQNASFNTGEVLYAKKFTSRNSGRLQHCIIGLTASYPESYGPKTLVHGF